MNIEDSLLREIEKLVKKQQKFAFHEDFCTEDKKGSPTLKASLLEARLHATGAELKVLRKHRSFICLNKQ